VQKLFQLAEKNAVQAQDLHMHALRFTMDKQSGRGRCQDLTWSTFHPGTSMEVT
jgi:hypothetical protein